MLRHGEHERVLALGRGVVHAALQHAAAVAVARDVHAVLAHRRVDRRRLLRPEALQAALDDVVAVGVQHEREAVRIDLAHEALRVLRVVNLHHAPPLPHAPPSSMHL